MKLLSLWVRGIIKMRRSANRGGVRLRRLSFFEVCTEDQSEAIELMRKCYLN